MHVEREPEVGVPVHVDRVVPERAHRGHNKAQGGDERERETQTRFHGWRLVLEKCLCGQGALVRLLLLPLRRRSMKKMWSMKMETEQEEGGSVFVRVSIQGQYLKTMWIPSNICHSTGVP